VSDEVVAAYRSAAAPPARTRALLLGATPQLSDIAGDVTAVEASAAVIATRWPGDTAHRRAIEGDWRAMQFAKATFDLCVGDIALNVLPSLDDAASVLDRIAGFLAPGGRIAIRAVLRPERRESVTAVFNAAFCREIAGFGAFKWRLMMAMAAERASTHLRVADALARFNETVLDREAFSRQTGMARADVDAIDAYQGSSEIYCLPTSADLVSALGSRLRLVEYRPSGTYELAERFPIAVMDLR
jgi:SAM-dependent methyltransferase